MRRSDTLRRRGPSRDPHPVYLVVCEGQVTERHYLEDLRLEQRIPIRIRFRSGAVPRTLVDWAVEERREDDYDEVWVIFDVDDHPGVEATLDRARAHNLRVAMSNPCFELWALLHFQDQRAAVPRDKLNRLCRKHMPGYEKRLPFRLLSPLYETALGNAKTLAQWHETRGTTGANPSTNVYELTESIRSHRR